VAELAARREIVWWAIQPEELRPWRGDEMLYLETVAEAIRAADPLQRPLFLYNPNHRDAGTLEPIARHVDVVAKGCYVNSAGKKRHRAWVRWSVEQELEAIRRAGRPGAIALVMPELCQDPPPGEEGEIRAWVRHDVYLGLASGAKGVLIWSLFKRPAVRKTWQEWYDAYVGCARELNGERALGRVFLFGRRCTDLRVEPVALPDGAGQIELGGDAEPATSSPAERAARTVDAPGWTAVELAYENRRYLFVINSGNGPAKFAVDGWPAGSVAEDAFRGAARELPEAGGIVLELPAYGVAGLRFSAAGAVEHENRAGASRGP
jgi:hypothetical protein